MPDTEKANIKDRPMYSRILVAVDDDEISKLALDEAIKLAKDQKAKLCIVYVADEYIPAGEGVPVDFKQHEKSVKKQGQSILKKMVALARKQHNKVESSLIEIIEPNHIAAKIIAAADTWHADLIVLSTHGRKGLNRLLLGSVAEEVMRDATVPVHIVKGK